MTTTNFTVNIALSTVQSPIFISLKANYFHTVLIGAAFRRAHKDKPGVGVVASEHLD